MSSLTGNLTLHRQRYEHRHSAVSVLLFVAPSLYCQEITVKTTFVLGEVLLNTLKHFNTLKSNTKSKYLPTFLLLTGWWSATPELENSQGIVGHAVFVEILILN